MIANNQQAFLAWWGSFNDEYDDFDQADYSQYPDSELVSEIDHYAIQNGIKTVQVNNVDQLLEYALMVFTSVVALKAISYVGKSLKNEVKVTADFGRKVYDTAVQEISQKVINQGIKGVKWSHRIWSNQTRLRTDMSNILRESLLDSQNPTTYTKQIKDRYGVSRYEAERILRTEGARVSAEQQVKSIKSAGYKKLEWVAGAGSCQLCMELDGKRFKASSFGSGRYVIPKHPNCRCSVVAVEDSDTTLYED
ncbi:Uncharacterized protein R55210_AODCCCNP_01170 [Fructobacillus fructosus]|uniref:minor capsid protein n=1 Tax=Fructobacillus TaxID=559173 RepID=UPI00200A08B9|nr:minor capsid protein [Fructobacillus parabroussonetiae]MCK8617965.1 minor capsid protein [Fructobacillus parabroussonetiae]CAK1247960.1 Uncharacterized protein R55210_AODCCCNP_01170 [Fructobacillus fructosus]